MDSTIAASQFAQTPQPPNFQSKPIASLRIASALVQQLSHDRSSTSILSAFFLSMRRLQFASSLSCLSFGCKPPIASMACSRSPRPAPCANDEIEMLELLAVFFNLFD